LERVFALGKSLPLRFPPCYADQTLSIASLTPTRSRFLRNGDQELISSETVSFQTWTNYDTSLKPRKPRFSPSSANSLRTRSSDHLLSRNFENWPTNSASLSLSTKQSLVSSMSRLYHRSTSL